MHYTDHASVPESVSSGVFRGGRLLAVGTIIERLARLGRNLLLARLLVPDDFALMGITLAVIALFTAITEVGVAQAVVQNHRGSAPEFLNVAWWFGLARGLLVAAIALPLAVPIAHFYDEPRLGPLLAVAPLTVVLTGLTSPRIYALQRQFRFGATMWTTQGAGLLGTAFTIVLGLLLRDVWALLWGAVFEAFCRFLISFLLCPIRPRFRLDPQSRRDLFRFSRGMAGLSVLTLLVMQADTFVLGKVVDKESLGFYIWAVALAGFPLALFSKVVQPLVVPVLARHQDDYSAMRSQVLGISRLVWTFGLPLTVVLAIVGEPLLVLAYGHPGMAGAAPAFALYATFTCLYMASMVTFSVYLAIAQPELQRRFTLVRAVVVALTLYPLSVLWGGTGAATSLLVAMLVAMVVQLQNLRSVIGLQVGTYLGTVPPGLVAAVSAGAPCLLVRFCTDWAGWLQVLVCAAWGGVIWAVLLVRARRLLRAAARP